MENFDDYFKNLDAINHVEREIKCCEKGENYDMSDKNGVTCKVCHNCISNIIDTPEWKNYKNNGVNSSNGINGTRCGMPTNVLLPDSSLALKFLTFFLQNYIIKILTTISSYFWK